MLAHDHADIGGHSWMTETVQVVYDKRVFLTEDEYMEKHGKWRKYVCNYHNVVYKGRA